MWLTLDIAATHLIARRRASLVSIGGVAVGVMFFIGASSMLVGSQQDFIEKLVNSTPHITMRDEYRSAPLHPVDEIYLDGAVELRGIRPKEIARGIRKARATLAELEETPGLAAAPALVGSIILRNGSRDLSSTMYGIEPDRDARVSRLSSDLIAGQVTDLLTAPNGIILGSQLAERLGVRVGDMLVATSSAGSTLMVRVVGLFHTGVLSTDRGRSYALLRRAQVLLNRPNIVNRIQIRLDDYRHALPIARQIETRFGFISESWQEANEDVFAVLQLRNIIMFTIVGAILLVASFGIYNVISTIVHDKARDIAILKSIGFEAAFIRRVFILEGVLVGVAGALAGSALGVAIIEGIRLTPIEIKAVVEVQRLSMDRSMVHYVAAGAFAVVSATLAAYLPARRAAALRPVDILRGAI
jgi:lipoprotein-releasing system permease protein